MNIIKCENIFISKDEVERKEAFNEIWKKVVNLIIK